MQKLLTLGPVLFLAALTGMGCSNTAEGVKEDTNRASQVVSKEAENAERATKHAAEKAAPVVRKDAEKVADATYHATKNATAALEVTPRVKNAIIADSELDDTHNLINVDSADNIVHLKGHVVSDQMKQRAGKIAQRTLNQDHSTDQVSNELTVQP